MPIIEQIPGRTITISGEEWLYFSGTSYLGIAALPAFRTLLHQSIERYGTNFGGSRLANIQFKVFLEAETLLAKICGAPAAITVSSGTLAANVVMRLLQDQTSAPIHYAPEVHPALHWRTATSSSSRELWEQQMLEQAHRGKHPAIFVSNGIDPLRVVHYDFHWLKQLPNDIPYTLVIDDSHVLGVLGEDGGGSFRSLELPKNVDLIVVGSLGKAWGIPGGVILASEPFLKNLQRSSLFGGASPAIPAYLDAFVNAQALYREQRVKLKQNIYQFQSLIGAKYELVSIDPFPVFYSADQALADQLAKHKILISSFAYPSPESDLVTRIVLNALHEKADIEKLVHALNDIY